MARVRHGQGDWVSYHITTRTLEQRFYLAVGREKLNILSALDYYRRDGRFKIFGFVVMDNHVHVIVQPALGRRLGEIMRDFKTWTSRRNGLKPPGQPLWERRYDDNEIRSTAELRNVINYIYNNPVRAGVVAEAPAYRWSSVHNYMGDGRELIEIDTDWWQY